VQRPAQVCGWQAPKTEARSLKCEASPRHQGGYDRNPCGLGVLSLWGSNTRICFGLRPSHFGLIPPRPCPPLVPTVVPRWHSGATPVPLPYGERILLCLQAFEALFGNLKPCFGLRRALLAHPILLTGQPAPLAQAWAASDFGAGGNARVLLFVGQRRAVTPGGSAQSSAPGALVPGPRVSRLDPEAAALLVSA
jgi:hypothetical protein